jgi:hypothetical protein
MELTSNEFTNLWLPWLLAVLVQASFGLSLSLLTLMSGHALSRRASVRRLAGLSFSYILGTVIAVAGLLVSLIYFASIGDFYQSKLVWSVVAGLTAVTGLIVALFYYRPGNGTTLWLPRSVAKFLTSRAKATRSWFESLLLGIGSILIELPFVVSPLLIAALLLGGASHGRQLIGISLYTLLGVLPTISLAVLVAGGHKVSRLQKWRINNKRFLQVAAGLAILVLAFYVVAFRLMEVS